MGFFLLSRPDGSSYVQKDFDRGFTTVVPSSIYDFREENGRTYNAYGDRSIVPAPPLIITVSR